MKSMRRGGDGGTGSSSSTSSSQLHREALQRRTQADWVNREYAELMTGSIKRIADFLTAFHLSCSSRLSDLNSRLTRMERKVEYLEARIEMRAGSVDGMVGEDDLEEGGDPTYFLGASGGVGAAMGAPLAEDETDYHAFVDTANESHT